MRYTVLENLCEKCGVRFSDINVDYYEMRDEIKIYGHMTDERKEAIKKKIEIAVDFIDKDNRILYTTTALQHGNFNATGFTTFYLRMGEIRTRMRSEEVSLVQIYPFM